MGVARSGIGWFIGKTVALGASWLAAIYFTRALVAPQATLGQFYLFETIISLLTLVANAGTNSAITKLLSGQSDDDARERFVGAGIIISMLLLGAVVLLAVALLPVYHLYFEAGVVVGFFVVLYLLLFQVKSTATAILRGSAKIGRSGAVELVDSLGRAVSQVLLIAAGAGLVGLVAGAVVGPGIAAIVAVSMVGIGVARPSRDEVAEVANYAKSTAVSGFTTKFYDNIDILVITYFLGSAAAGVYGIGFRFALPVMMFSGAVREASLPEISQQMGRGNRDQVEEVLEDTLVYSTLLAIPATVGVAMLANPLIVTAYTEAFAGAASIAVIGVAIQIPNGVRSVFSTTFNAIGRPDLPARAGMILIAINLVLDLVLVPSIGPFGAILASLVGITVATVYLGYWLFDELNLSHRAFPYRELSKQVASALLMGAVVYGLRTTISLPILWKLLVTILVGVLVYFGVLVTISPGTRERLHGIAQDVVPVI